MLSESKGFNSIVLVPEHTVAIFDLRLDGLAMCVTSLGDTTRCEDGRDRDEDDAIRKFSPRTYPAEIVGGTSCGVSIHWEKGCVSHL